VPGPHPPAGSTSRPSLRDNWRAAAGNGFTEVTAGVVVALLAGVFAEKAAPEPAFPRRRMLRRFRPGHRSPPSPRPSRPRRVQFLSGGRSAFCPLPVGLLWPVPGNADGAVQIPGYGPAMSDPDPATSDGQRSSAPGARTVGVLIGCAFAGYYLIHPPPEPTSKAWVGTAGQVLATLVLALVLEARAFKPDKMRAHDAVSAIIALFAAILALIATVMTAAYDKGYAVGTGALVVGAGVSLSWIVLTDILDPLVARARPDTRRGKRAA
jgi:hypothetical protein